MSSGGQKGIEKAEIITNLSNQTNYMTSNFDNHTQK